MKKLFEGIVTPETVSAFTPTVSDIRYVSTLYQAWLRKKNFGEKSILKCEPSEIEAQNLNGEFSCKRFVSSSLLKLAEYTEVYKILCKKNQVDSSDLKAIQEELRKNGSAIRQAMTEESEKINKLLSEINQKEKEPEEKAVSAEETNPEEVPQEVAKVEPEVSAERKAEIDAQKEAEKVNNDTVTIDTSSSAASITDPDVVGSYEQGRPYSASGNGTFDKHGVEGDWWRLICYAGRRADGKLANGRIPVFGPKDKSTNKYIIKIQGVAWTYDTRKQINIADSKINVHNWWNMPTFSTKRMAEEFAKSINKAVTTRNTSGYVINVRCKVTKDSRHMKDGERYLVDTVCGPAFINSKSLYFSEF